MSVNLMSAIFETEFFDLKDESGNVTKASTAKLILLAMADHANDEGEGAYPAIERLCRKTALSEQTIRNTFDALRYNGIISLEGRSKYGTNNHTINTKSFPKAIGKETVYLTLYPLGGLMSEAGGSNQSPSLVLPVIPESLLTTKESSKPTARIDRTPEEQEQLDKKKFDDLFPQSQDELDETKHRDEIAAHYESEMGYNPLQWWTDKKLMRLLKFLLTKTPAEITTFANWSKREYSPLSPTQARKNPDLVIECWPQACQTSEANFTKPPTDGKGFYA